MTTLDEARQVLAMVPMDQVQQLVFAMTALERTWQVLAMSTEDQTQQVLAVVT